MRSRRGGVPSGEKRAVTAREYATWKRLRFAPLGSGMTVNDGYNVPTFGITYKQFYRIQKAVDDLVGSLASGRELPSLQRVNENIVALGI